MTEQAPNPGAQQAANPQGAEPAQGNGPAGEPVHARDLPGDQPLDGDQIQELLEFDPFHDGAIPGEPEPQAPGSPEAPGASQGAQEPAAQPTPTSQPAEPTPLPGAPVPGVAPPAGGEPVPPGLQPPAQAQPAAQPQTPPQPDPRDQELNLLRSSLAESNQLLAQLRNELQQAQASRQAAPQPGAPGAPTQAAAPLGDPNYMPAYEYAIPAHIMDGLTSEDPNARHQALMNLVKGTGQQVHRQVMEAMRAEIPRLVRPQVQEHVQSADDMRGIFNDFYSTYPQLQDPRYRNTVQEAANEIVSQYPNAPWSPELKQAIGQRAFAKIQEMAQLFSQPGATPAPVNVPAPVGATPPGVPPAPPHQVAPNARPGMVPDTSVAAQIQDLMF